jgi:hypothetical protein
VKNLIITSFILSALTAVAQIGGSATYDFLQLPVSARSAALGGDFISVRDGDLSLAAENPSFLDSSVNNHICLGDIPYFDGINYSYAAYAKSIRNIGTFDAGIKFIDYGTFTAADYSGNITGTFSADEFLVYAGYGRPLKDSTFSVGANLKFINSVLDQYHSSGGAIDLSASYVSPNKLFYMGLVLQNLGVGLENYTPSNGEPLPLDLMMGFSYKLKHAPFRFNIIARHLQVWNLTYTDPTDTQTVNPLTDQPITNNNSGGFADNLMRHIVISTELLLGKNFIIRLGYNYEVRKELELLARPALLGFSGGAEIKIYKFRMGYGMAYYQIGGLSNTFSLAVNLSEFYSRRG